MHVSKLLGPCLIDCLLTDLFRFRPLDRTSQDLFPIMAEESIIDLRSPSPHSSRRRRNTPYNPPTNPPSTPPVGFRSLLNPPRPAPRSSVVRAGGAHDGRRIAEVIRQRAETRDTREASADSVRARRPGIQAGPSRTGQGPWAESIQVVGSSDEDDEIVVTGASNLPAQRSPSPPVQALHSPVRRRAVEAGRFDRAMQGELGRLAGRKWRADQSLDFALSSRLFPPSGISTSFILQ